MDEESESQRYQKKLREEYLEILRNRDVKDIMRKYDQNYYDTLWESALTLLFSAEANRNELQILEELLNDLVKKYLKHVEEKKKLEYHSSSDEDVFETSKSRQVPQNINQMEATGWIMPRKIPAYAVQSSFQLLQNPQINQFPGPNFQLPQSTSNIQQNMLQAAAFNNLNSIPQFQPIYHVGITNIYQSPPPQVQPNQYQSPPPQVQPNQYQSPAPQGQPSQYRNPPPQVLPNQYQSPAPQVMPNQYQSSAPQVLPNHNLPACAPQYPRIRYPPRSHVPNFQRNREHQQSRDTHNRSPHYSSSYEHRNARRPPSQTYHRDQNRVHPEREQMKKATEKRQQCHNRENSPNFSSQQKSSTIPYTEVLKIANGNISNSTVNENRNSTAKRVSNTLDQSHKSDSSASAINKKDKPGTKKSDEEKSNEKSKTNTENSEVDSNKKRKCALTVTHSSKRPKECGNKKNSTDENNQEEEYNVGASTSWQNCDTLKTKEVKRDQQTSDIESFKNFIKSEPEDHIVDNDNRSTSTMCNIDIKQEASDNEEPIDKTSSNKDKRSECSDVSYEDLNQIVTDFIEVCEDPKLIDLAISKKIKVELTEEEKKEYEENYLRLPTTEINALTKCETWLSAIKEEVEEEEIVPYYPIFANSEEQMKF